MANAANRKAVEAANRREKGARNSELEDVRHLMSTPRGRSLTHRLLTVSGCDRALPFNANAMSLSHDVGVQQMGFFLLSEIREACPEQELVMRREAAILAQRAALQDEVDDDQ
jgi:hypothetical protein